MVFCVVFSFCCIYAQDVTFGAKGGINFSSLNGDDDDLDGKTSFHIGGVAEIPVSDVFSVQPELIFSSQGAKDGDIKFNVSYLNIPIMAKYYVGEGISIEGGPQVGLLMDAKVKDDDTSVDVKDETKGVEFGIGIGAGYKVASGLNFALRYNVGLSNIVDEDDAGDFELKNGVFQVSVGFFF